MDYFTYSQKMDYLKELIEKEQLLSLKQVSKQFDCSERTVGRMIAHLKRVGYNVKYCRRSRKYMLNNY